MNRTENAIKNISWGWISKIISLVLSFASRTVFIYFLGKTYLGVSGLYTEILNMLSFAELGFGTALTFAMYKPVADADEEKTLKLLSFYKKIYRIIALLVAGIGVLLIPVLQYIVKGADELTLFQLRLFFVIYLANTVVNYFVSYKYSYVNALQKNYIITNFDAIVNFFVVVLQMIAIAITKSFLAYLLVNFLVLIVSRIAISIYLNKKFPILKADNKLYLTKEEKAPIYKDVKGLVIHQFSSVAVHSTDNIIISSLSGLGVVAVGLISNYNMIINAVLGFVVIIFGSVTSSFGNLVASSTIENYEKAFKDMNFINFWIYGFCSIAFFVLIPPFITLWLGVDFLIDEICFLLIIINCYLLGQSTIYNNARIAKGDFSKDKWISLAQAIVNLVISIIGAMLWGLLGVYIGTVVSRLVTVIFKPMKTYRLMFEKNCVHYYKYLTIYFVITAISGCLTYFVVGFILKNVTILSFMLATLVVAILPNIIFFLCFFKTKEFQSLKKRILSFVGRRKA